MAEETRSQLKAAEGYGVPGIKVLQVGLELPEGLSQDQCRVIVQKLGQEQAGWQWRVADALLYSDRTWGEMYKEASELLGKEEATLMNWVSVAKAFQFSRRREDLSFSHHAAAQTLEPDRADELLAKAATGKWSESRLREEVRTIKGEEREERWAARLNKSIPYTKVVIEERDDARDNTRIVYRRPEGNSTESKDEEQGVRETSRVTSRQPYTPTSTPLLVTIDPVGTSLHHIKGLLALFSSGRFPADDKQVDERARTLYRELAKLYAVESSSSLPA